MKTKKGSALLLTTILMFIILSIVVSLTYVTVMEQKMSQKTKSSVGAFYGAESGIEWALNKIAHSDGTDTIATAFTGNIVGQNANCPFGTDTCQVYFLGADGKVLAPATDTISEVKAVRSVGAQGGETQRAVEAAVASTTCPSGFTSIESGTYQLGCIETNEHGSGLNWFDAENTCFSTYGGRLPFYHEWYLAMRNYNLSKETDNWEWMSEEDNATIRACGVAGLTLITETAGVDPNNAVSELGVSVGYRCWLPRYNEY